MKYIGKAIATLGICGALAWVAIATNSPSVMLMCVMIALIWTDSLI